MRKGRQRRRIRRRIRRIRRLPLLVRPDKETPTHTKATKLMNVAAVCAGTKGPSEPRNRLLRGLTAAPRPGPRALTCAGAVCTRSAWVGATACAAADVLTTEVSALWRARGSVRRPWWGLPSPPARGYRAQARGAAVERALAQPVAFSDELQYVWELQVDDACATTESLNADRLQRVWDVQLHDALATPDGECATHSFLPAPCP